MADQFKEWDRFERHLLLTQDPKKALAWSKHERWAEKRRMKAFQRWVDSQVTKSVLSTYGSPSGRTTKG